MRGGPWRTALLALLAVCACLADVPDGGGAADSVLTGPAADSRWPALLAAQFTYVLQHQTALDSPYQGHLSLHPEGDTQPTYTIGFYGGWAAFNWAQLYLDTEKFMGAGVSGATGLGGLTNGDVVREGAVGLKKTFYIARAYVRLMLPLGPQVSHVERGRIRSRALKRIRGLSSRRGGLR